VEKSFHAPESPSGTRKAKFLNPAMIRRLQPVTQECQTENSETSPRKRVRKISMGDQARKRYPNRKAEEVKASSARARAGQKKAVEETPTDKWRE
jgi:hypothetical protein